ncbi:unnamed protein product [Ectocarpus sp. CCAP 1310/34]|nr:unnamed protein product [Ectocarpus sp. CCAP 1310/34]
MASAALITIPMQRGFVPVDGDDASFPVWVTLTRFLMQKSGLGKTMSGKEQPLEALTGDEAPDERAAHATAMEQFAERNGELYMRLLMSTSDGAGGFSRAASQVVQRYCHNSKEHEWHNCPLRLSQEAEEAKGQASHVTQESTTQAWFTRIEGPSSQLEDFAIVIGDDTQVQTEPDDYMRVQKAPVVAALPETRAANNPQVQDVPAAVLRDERAAGDVPVQAVLVATTHLQAEEASDGTEYVAYTVFQVEPVYRTKVDADMWHRRMSHCHPRALQQLAEKATTGVRYNRNIEPGDCGVCAVGDSKKGSHPPSNRTRATTRLEILSADVWGPHPVKSSGGCQSAGMFTDHLSRMRFGFLLKTKNGVAESLQELIQNEADILGTCIGKVHCDGGAEFKGRFQALCESMGIKVDSSPPYVPQGNAIAERGFGTIIGTARKLLLGAPHLPGYLWGEAFHTAIYLKNRTPTEVLGGKAPLEHEEARLRNTKLSARAKKMYHVGYNTKNRTYRLWEPAEPLEITNSAEVSFREKETRDVVTPKKWVSNAPEGMNLHTTEEAYERTEHALMTGSVLDNIGTGRPGEASYRPADPASYDAAVNGKEGALWKENVSDEGMTAWRFARKLVWWCKAFYEADTGADKAAPVASMESVHMVLAVVAHNHLVLKQADIKTTFLHARIPEEAEPTYAIPSKRFPCSPGQAKLVWLLKAWLYGLRLSPKGWNGTFHVFLLELGFVQSTADPCLYSLQDGEVLLLVYVDDILFTGTNEDLVTTVISRLKERASTKAVLATFNMADAHPTKTPAEVGPITTAEDEVLSPEDTKNFRSATGSVLYLCRGTRPDIAHSVLVLTRSMAKPGPEAMAKLKRLLRYLKGTTSIGITYSEDAEDGDKITAYADSDFGGDLDDRKSTTGIVLFLAGGPVGWRAAKQPLVAASSVEAEYVALSKACLPAPSEDNKPCPEGGNGA